MFKNRINLILIIAIALVLTATGIMAGMVVKRNNDSKTADGKKAEFASEREDSEDEEEAGDADEADDVIVISDEVTLVTGEDFDKWLIGQNDADALMGMSGVIYFNENLVKDGFNSKKDLVERLDAESCRLLFDYTTSEKDLLCSGEYVNLFNGNPSEDDAYETRFDGCFYNSDREEILAYVSVFNECGIYVYSDVWSIYPYDGTYSFAINGIERLYMNTNATVKSPDDKYEVTCWVAFCVDMDRVHNGESPVYGVSARVADDYAVTVDELNSVNGFADGYYILDDSRYLDFDNDGEIEALIGTKAYDCYGGYCFDFNDDGMSVLAKGDGSAVYLETPWYENAMWISYRDTSHAGRETYGLSKYGDGGTVTDTIYLASETLGDYPQQYDVYTYNSGDISEEEFEAYKAKIYKSNTAKIADDALYNIVRNPALSDCRRAYRDKIDEYYSANCENQNDWCRVLFGFIYLDDDDIPELTCGLGGYYQSVYTYKDGELKCLMDDWGYGAMGNAGYSYYPGKGIVTNTNSDYAGAVVYYSFIQYDSEKASLDECEVYSIVSSIARDTNGNGYLDEAGNWYDENYSGEGEDVWYYYDEKGNEINEEQFNAYFEAYGCEEKDITGSEEHDYLMKLL